MKAFEAIGIGRGGQRSCNRIWLAAMTNQQSNADGTLGEQELAWLAARARGGFGGIATCAVNVSKEGQGWEGELGAWAEIHDDGLARLGAAVAEGGALGMVQIFHAGARAPLRLTGAQPISVADAYPPGEAGKVDCPRAASEADLERIIAAFAEAAQRVERAGWPGVEIHGAHGYLLAQFLSPRYNQRTDGWGGTHAGRMRLLRAVYRAIRQVTSPEFIVGVRLSPRTYAGDGVEEARDCLKTAQELADEGIDFLHASLWDCTLRLEPEQAGSPLLIEAFRAALPSTLPLVVAGGIRGLADINRCLDAGADVVAIGKAAIAYADLPLRLQAQPDWQPDMPPYTAQQLRDNAVGERFIQYLRRWDGFIASAS